MLRLVLERSLVLRVPESEPALHSPFGFAVDADDALYFNDPFGTIGVRVFSPSGEFIRQLGRRGGGPGEFLVVRAIVPQPAGVTSVFGNAHSQFSPAPDPKFGNVYDHFDVVYEWDDGAIGVVQCRQMDGAHGENLDTIVGADGVMRTDGWNGRIVVDGARPLVRENLGNDMYQREHDELFASIRAGEPINQGVAMAHSTLAGIMGRMSAYTGQKVTWEMALNSQERLLPDDADWAWGDGLKCEVAMPGRTKFV